MTAAVIVLAGRPLLQIGEALELAAGAGDGIENETASKRQERKQHQAGRQDGRGQPRRRAA